MNDIADDAVPALTLHKATGFWGRLRGLRARDRLPWHNGLYLSPCRAIHTFGMSYAIDIVFLDACNKPLKQISKLAPGRVACCLRAAYAVELPAGYCLAYPAYPSAIERCLHPCRHRHHHGPRPDN